MERKKIIGKSIAFSIKIMHNRSGCVNWKIKEGVKGLADLIQMDSYPVQTTLKILLQDKSTKKNIIWATDSYASFGESYTDKSQMTESQLTKINGSIIQPRILKDIKQQTHRTRKNAEVFTPAWICNNRKFGVGFMIGEAAILSCTLN